MFPFKKHTESSKNRKFCYSRKTNNQTEYKSNYRFLFLRFIGFFVFMSISFLIVGGLLGSLLHPENFPIKGEERGFFSSFRCIGPLLFFCILFYFGMLAYRRMGKPIANFMTATEAVAEGDLTIRIPEKGHAQMRKLSEAFNHMVEELAHADQQRKYLTADIAHELRTPIHILRGNLEGIYDGIYEANPVQLESMLQEIQILSRLVDDLQTISLAEAGQLTLHKTEVNIGELLADVYTSFILQTEEKGIRLLVDIKEEDLIIQADPERLDQVFTNLVTNAIHYSSAEQSISLIARKNEQNSISIIVKDEGQGISAEELPFIFDRFYRADKSRTRKIGGSGLGLTIVRQLIKLHGGSVEVKSDIGKGTEFTIILPV